MNSPIQIFESRNCRRGRRKRAKRHMCRSGLESSLRNLGVVKQITKSVRKRIRISGQCLNSFVEGLYEKTLDLTEERNIVEYRHCKSNILEQTIDLCDSSLESSSSNVASVRSLQNEEKQTVHINLSKDFPTENEVIDLTEMDNIPASDCRAVPNSQPTMIDISDETAKEDTNPKSDNDEICVIGTFTRSCDLNKKNSSRMPLANKWSNFSSLISCSEKLRRKYLQKHSVFDKVEVKKKNQFEDVSRPHKSLTKIGGNVYVNSPVTLPSSGLRPIIIDGSNVAFVHSTCNFSCKRLEICINYFKEKGHKVTAFVPQFRLNSHRSDDPQLLRRLEKNGDVVLTPSKKIDGRNIVPYDDRFIVQTAVLKGGVIVTRDNYNDLLRENPSWAETIKYRTLAFTWVDDVLMFPKDPLGEYGPSLEEFLRFH